MSVFEHFKSIFRNSDEPREHLLGSDLPHSAYPFPDIALEKTARTITVGSAQSTGIERSHNEDSLLVFLGNTASHNTIPSFGLFIVADGMGGHRAGEIASSVSVRTVAHRFLQETFLRLLDQRSLDEMPPLLDIMRDALQEANQHVVQVVPGGGTTLTTVAMLGHQLTIGHVGDSRAYLLQDDSFELLTRDHSLVERLRELGQLTKEEADNHPQRNVLYRAIGQGESLEVDVETCRVPNGASLLICSDGLWGVVEEDAILRIITSSKHPQEACERMVSAANEAGGPDNITAILIHFPLLEE